MPHLLISAAHKSSGKTTLTTGLCAALTARGHVVQPFKKGPDYIDPLWLSAASVRDCINLDFHSQTESEITACFHARMQGADIGLIEGNKGLFDGLDLEGGNSNAALARLLGAPVLLVIDTQGMTRGIAPLLQGYLNFESGLNFAGVILNKVGGSRHEGKLLRVIEHFTDLEVLGAVGRHQDLLVAERHLGLIPSNEASDAKSRIARFAEIVAAEVDLDKVIEKTALAPPMAKRSAGKAAASVPRADIRIGYARDAAFSFYYPDDLDQLRRAGAEMVPIDTLSDAHLPDIDGLLLGGGFPETNMKALEANESLRHQIRDAIRNGLPAYAECGGLMYLSQRIIWQGMSAEMAGVIRGDAVMYDRPQGRGYVVLKETDDHPWPHLPEERLPGSDQPGTIPAHEFHYSRLENCDCEPVYAFDVLRGAGLDGHHDGLVQHNLLAGYTHMRNVGANNWARRFAMFVRQCKANA